MPPLLSQPTRSGMSNAVAVERSEIDVRQIAALLASVERSRQTEPGRERDLAGVERAAQVDANGAPGIRKPAFVLIADTDARTDERRQTGSDRGGDQRTLRVGRVGARRAGHLRVFRRDVLRHAEVVAERARSHVRAHAARHADVARRQRARRMEQRSAAAAPPEHERRGGAVATDAPARSWRRACSRDHLRKRDG